MVQKTSRSFGKRGEQGICNIWWWMDGWMSTLGIHNPFINIGHFEWPWHLSRPSAIGQYLRKKLTPCKHCTISQLAPTAQFARSLLWRHVTQWRRGRRWGRHNLQTVDAIAGFFEEKVEPSYFTPLNWINTRHAQCSLRPSVFKDKYGNMSSTLWGLDIWVDVIEGFLCLDQLCTSNAPHCCLLHYNSFCILHIFCKCVCRGLYCLLLISPFAQKC